MTQTADIRERFIALAAFAAMLTLALMVLAPAARAAATSWVDGMHNRARLIAGPVETGQQSATVMAGIHLELEPGWHTYWRYPGDSGLPPRFDWSASRNLKEARVLWPAPIRFSDPSGTSIGYKKEVVFPVAVEPARAGEPVELDLAIEYAVCKDICIPVEAALKLILPAREEADGDASALLARYVSRVPREAGAGAEGRPSVSKARARLSGEAPHLTVEARFPGDGAGADLFIEGPEGMYLPTPEPVARSGDGAVTFRVDLSEAGEPSKLKGETLTLTLVSRNAQSEARWRLD